MNLFHELLIHQYDPFSVAIGMLFGHLVVQPISTWAYILATRLLGKVAARRKARRQQRIRPQW